MTKQANLRLQAAAALTALAGIITLSSTLLAIAHRHNVRIVVADAHLTVIAGLSLIYLASLLRRGKHNAWLISLPVFLYLLIRNFEHFVVDLDARERRLPAILNLAVPLAALILLAVSRNYFTVRSEIRSFGIASRRAVIVLVVAFLYGIFGFALMDDRDFHQELSFSDAAHYTVDQLDLTTSRQIVPYTHRAQLFLDSLGTVSLLSVAYVGASLFAPIRFRLRHSRRDLADAAVLVKKHSLTSEDFFKLWPRDKAYLFSPDRQAVIAYRVVHGVALAVGDPIGPRAQIKPLLQAFLEYCRLNDWSPAFIHTDKTYLKLYELSGLSVQKIGEEALIDIANFNHQVARNKYFRHINNKFSKQNYRCETLEPPHSQAVLDRLKLISQQWLAIPGRAERGLMMGSFSEAYLQATRIMVLYDAAGQIQAFLNQVPSYKPGEANYDLLRQSSQAPTNANDFLMINFMRRLGDDGYRRLNMGLSPLSGLDPKASAERSGTDSLLHLVYVGADRFYSFQGLAKFKSKYEPAWADRYIVYRGGLPGFSRTMTALLRAMKI